MGLELQTKWKDNNKKIKIIYLLLLGSFYFIWAWVQPFNVSPDEAMRYLIPQYIFNHGTLPIGTDPEIINSIWGNSYGFNPITSYIISAVFMKIVSFVSTNATALLMAARLVSVLFGVGTAYMSMKIAELVFKNSLLYQWFYIILVSLLPENIFVSSYVNIDAMAIFAATFVIYVWLVGMKNEWRIRDCFALGIGISLCLLSYYNTYGYVLCSFFLFILSFFIHRNGASGKQLMGLLMRRGMIVVVVVAVCAGWWFVRNYFLYDGDILGMRACNECAEQLAQPTYKPSNLPTYQKAGISIIAMLFGGKWLFSSAVSFIAAFASCNAYIAVWMYLFVLAVVVLGGLGILANLKKSFGIKINGVYYVRGILHWFMVAAAVMTVGISAYYSYSSNYQPQGRYCLPMLPVLMYFTVWGIERIGRKQEEQESNLKSVAVIGIIIIYMIIAVLSFTNYFWPLYK